MFLIKGEIILNFHNFVQEIQQNHWNVYGVEVYENGILTHSYGDTDEHLHGIYSATKTVLSIAVGIAWDRGLIELNKAVTEYLPVDILASLDKEQRDTFNRITIHRLLTMSVGDFPFRAEGDNFLKFALNCKIQNPDEKVFNYSNISAYLVGVALHHALGEDVGVFIEKNIFEPLGITRYEYGRSPEGYFYGASEIRLTVSSLSKIGQLLYNGGVHDGKRILSEEYVRMATSVQQMNREGGYGYFVWKYLDGFSINGKWGQKCYCLPERGLMITFLSHIEEDTYGLKRSMEQHLLHI